MPRTAGRALKAWRASRERRRGQRAFTHRARMNSLASTGEWKADLEKKAA